MDEVIALLEPHSSRSIYDRDARPAAVSVVIEALRADRVQSLPALCQHLARLLAEVGLWVRLQARTPVHMAVDMLLASAEEEVRRL